MKYKFLLVLLLSVLAAPACPVCDRAKAKSAFGSIAHGPAPGSSFDYLIVWFTIAIALIVLFITIKKLAKPGEKQSDHIKYSILQHPQCP